MSNLQQEFMNTNEEFVNKLVGIHLKDIENKVSQKDRDDHIKILIKEKSKIADNVGLSRFDEKYYQDQFQSKLREEAERNNPLLSTRQVRMDGGLLENDDERYGMLTGGQMKIAKAAPPFNEITADDFKELRDKNQEGGRIGYKDGPSYSEVADMHNDPKAVKELIIFMEKVGNKSNEVIDNVVIPYMRKTGKSFAEGLDYVGNKVAEGGQKAADMIDQLEERFKKQEGGEIDDQMSMLMGQQEPEQEMLPDEEMEDNYMDFILDEALTEEEEDMLMSKLEQDEQLSMLFDKVVEVASEFAGSGPVEGPGTGVSDSIPARLSDGEFVFTAKAVEEIGADELMRMMKDAEMRADERQGMANGGEAEEEDTVVMQPEQEPVRQDIRVTKETVGYQASMPEKQDLVDEEIKKGMLSNRPYVRS